MKTPSKKIRSAMHFSQEYHPYNCFYCGVSLLSEVNSGQQITIDHVIPTSRGGADTIANKVTACRFCNLQKANLLIEEYRRKCNRMIFWAEEKYQKHRAARLTLKKLK